VAVRNDREGDAPARGRLLERLRGAVSFGGRPEERCVLTGAEAVEGVYVRTFVGDAPAYD
jgi:hypothetical protein